MRKFLNKILVYSLAIIIIMCFFDLFISYNLKKSNAFNGDLEIWNDIYNGNINADVAIYGSSRAWTQLDPEIFSSVLEKKIYNLGVDGHNFWIQYLRHIEYLKNNTNPKVILVNLDIFSFDKRKNLYQLEQFMPYALWNKEIKKYTESYIGFSKLDYYIPLLRYARQTKAIKNAFYIFFNPEKTTFRKKGYRAFNLKWGEMNDIITPIDKYEINFDDKTIALFEQFIKECKNLDIKLLLLYTPEYIEGQNKVTNRLQLLNICNHFSKKYNLPFLNYSKDSLQLKKKYFYNSMHLNQLGANKISKKIAEHLKKLRF